jgi:hypothetical protein
MLSFSEFNNNENLETEKIKNFLNDDKKKDNLAILNKKQTKTLFVENETDDEVNNNFKPLSLPNKNTLNYPVKHYNVPNDVPNNMHNTIGDIPTNTTNTVNERKLEGTLDRLNHIIHLLEQQQNEKTETVVEELILYLFLGFLIIYVIDSFFRAGKYVR